MKHGWSVCSLASGVWRLGQADPFSSRSLPATKLMPPKACRVAPLAGVA